jgi:hypothetical protein
VLDEGGGEGAGAARSGGGADAAAALNDQDRKMLTNTHNLKLVALRVVDGRDRRRSGGGMWFQNVEPNEYLKYRLLIIRKIKFGKNKEI